MDNYKIYLKSKNDYKIINEWSNIIDINNIWKCIDNHEIVVSNKNIDILTITSDIFCDIMKNQFWTVSNISRYIDTINTNSILRGISNRYKITILVINHNGSYKLYDSGEIVIMLYRYNDVRYRQIGLLRNGHVYRYIHKHSYDYEHILERVLYTGVSIL